jgi:hypothetical protein
MAVVLISPQKFADSMLVLSMLWMLEGVSLIAFSCTRLSDNGDTNVRLNGGRFRLVRGLCWTYAASCNENRMQHHVMKTVYNIRTKFHIKLSFASKVINGDSLIE